MSEKPKKKEIQFQKEADREVQEAVSKEVAISTIRMRSTEPKSIRKVSPLGMRVLVKLRKDNNVSEGGLYLPEGAKQNMSESVLAEVIEVASALDIQTDEESNISGIPLGALVLISKIAGTRVPWDDTLRLVETKEVLAIVHEMSVT